VLFSVDDVPVAVQKDGKGNSVAIAFDVPSTRPFPVELALQRGTRISHADFERMIDHDSD
jgi:hypothetical protein